ncbi:LytR/AlgR family response regulator transcription factor [Mariniflexile gromovii]|uniref:LytTR family transcriptional regulator DNA-binding domain-containing protein n=1 Tax=Mariniflexile gromovii TaxID=362523 RepID=A0ABS4BTL3_9FLAO|nr:LytTR family transcriptional regulator DNA-binding domain-containing protein [Mariniflexile gromovii]MBP0903924.1 LytTR family transcriptional regulator DNA-binding domain-containing protein [Mariniflexile gromovii]
MKTNQPIKILIVEDEMIIAANMSLQLTTLGYEVTGIMLKGEEAIMHIKQNKPDIILLDIHLQGTLDGIETAQIIQLDYNIPIIYVTANSDDAHFNKAKDTNPYGFISKPFKKQDLQRTIELAVHRFYSENQPETEFTEEEEKETLPFILSDCIFVRHQDKMVKVQIADILYIEAERNYSRIHSKNKEYLLVVTLKDLEDKLPENHFIRIHRSFIVNLSQIDEIATSHIVISKKAIPISAESKKQLLQHIQKV